MVIKRMALILLLSLMSFVALVRQDAFADGFTPPEDGYDWVQLTSDEWLKGELVSLFDDELLFDSDHFGDVTIDLEDVRKFRGYRRFGVSIQGVGLVQGRLRVDEQQVVIVGDEAEYVYARQRLVAVTASAERELDRWSADVGLGINIRRGNSDVVEYNMLAGIERRTPSSRVLVDYLGNFNETEGKRVANNHRVNASYDRFIAGRFFWRPLIGQYFRDPFQNIQHQGTLETGIGYELRNTARTDWNVSSGLGGNFVRYVSVQAGEPSDNTSPALSFGTNFDTEVTSWMDYLLEFQMTFLDEDSGAYQHHLLTTLSTDLIGKWDLDVSFVWDRTQNPQPREDRTVPEKDDYRLLVGVGFDF